MGLRGIPGIQGGIENHVENLAPRLAALGCDVEVIVRSPYFNKDANATWKGVRLRRIWSPRTKVLETIIHSLFATFYAVIHRPDVLHVHAVGPALFIPLARLFGLRVVFTHHTMDYKREKWGFLARAMLRVGERAGVLFANQLIAVSENVGEVISDYGYHCTIIPNGVSPPTPRGPGVVLGGFGLTQKAYVLYVGRIDKGKRIHDLEQAFNMSEPPDPWKLVIVGDLEEGGAYAQQIHDLALRCRGIILAGFQSGDSLAELYSQAGVFVLPSSHEGLPIALLEALSYGIPSLASDIPANREIGLPTDCYFPVGDTAALAAGLKRCFRGGVANAEWRELRSQVLNEYDWDRVSQRTLDVYRSAMVS